MSIYFLILYSFSKIFAHIFKIFINLPNKDITAKFRVKFFIIFNYTSIIKVTNLLKTSLIYIFLYIFVHLSQISQFLYDGLAYLAYA